MCSTAILTWFHIWGCVGTITEFLCFSLFSQLGGCGILGVGIWLAVTQGNFATLSSSFPSLSAANLLIVTGTFVMIIGFVGCIGAIKENKCLLLSVSIELLQCLLSCAAGAIAMHAAVTCISTEAALLTQMRHELCVKGFDNCPMELPGHSWPHCPWRRRPAGRELLMVV